MPATILSMFPGLMSGRRLVDEGEIQQLLQLLFSTQAGFAASNVDPGPVLTAATTQIISGTKVTLPPALAGRQMIIINDSTDVVVANVCPANPANGGKPDVVGVGNNYGDIPQGYACYFISIATGQWVDVGAIFAPSQPPATLSGSTTTTSTLRRASR